MLLCMGLFSTFLVWGEHRFPKKEKSRLAAGPSLLSLVLVSLVLVSLALLSLGLKSELTSAL